ncbi:MAG: nucleotidyltransferase family protein [Ginsengibacter sp.]
MIKEAIILAGGLGTRLRSVVADKPKCMAPVQGKPFLYYLIHFLKNQGIEHFIFSVGYMHEVIEEYLIKDFPDLNYTLSLETEPLGTGGGIQLACKVASQKNVIVCNGDTFYNVNLKSFSIFHEKCEAVCTLSMKPMINFDRYGVVELNEDNSVKSFKEKEFYASGLINGGMYALNVSKFLSDKLPEKFSFESGFLEKILQNSADEKPKLYGMIQDEYFIDIGIPEDYERAQKENFFFNNVD